VAIIASPGNALGALAAKAQTTTIPIVFSTANDPVQAGLVPSFNRPAGNVTGIVTMNVEIVGKQFVLLHELLPEGRTLCSARQSQCDAQSTSGD
jgi:putative ABC transport system substrate-binding protein